MAYGRTRRYSRRGSYRRPSYTRVQYVSAPRVSVRRKRRVTRRTKKTMKCSCPTELTPVAKFAFAQLDPFDVNASGAKIPDSNTMPSLSNSDTDIVSLTTSATSTHLNGMAFRPQYTWGTVTGTPGAAVDWGVAFVTNSANRLKRTSVAAAFELIRPVAHAVRISSPVAPTSASGFVHIGIATESIYNNSSWSYPTTIAGISGLQFYKRVTLASLTQSPLTVINKWLDDTAFRYSDPTSNIQGVSQGPLLQTDFSWGVIVVITEGVPTSTAVLSFEHLLLSEGIPKYDAAIVGTQAAPNVPGVIGAVSTMQTQQEPFHTEAEQSDYIRRGTDALVQGAQAAGTRAFNEVGLPLLDRLGQYAVTAGLNYAAASIAGRGGIGGVNNNPNRLAIQH